MIALLKFAIFLFFFVPPLFFIPGRFGTHWILTTYREPKLAACQILGWITISIFWAAFAFSKKWTEDFNKKLKSAIRYKWLWLLFVFFMYICWTSTRALVIEASYYEMFQYITILNLVFINQAEPARCLGDPHAHTDSLLSGNLRGYGRCPLKPYSG